MDFSAPANRAISIVAILQVVTMTFGLVAVFPPFTPTALLAVALILLTADHLLALLTLGSAPEMYGGLLLGLDGALLVVLAVAFGHLVLLGRLGPGQIARHVDAGRGYDRVDRAASYSEPEAQRPFVTRTGPVTYEILFARFYALAAAFFALLLSWQSYLGQWSASTVSPASSRYGHYLVWWLGLSLCTLTVVSRKLRESDSWALLLGGFGILAGVLLLRGGT